jgi:hypothetical protein
MRRQMNCSLLVSYVAEIGHKLEVICLETQPVEFGTLSHNRTLDYNY